MKTTPGFRRVTVAIAASFIFLLSPASAQFATWNGLGSSNNASDADNWVGGALPTVSDVIILDSTSSKNMVWDAGVNGLTATVAGWSQTLDYTGVVAINTTYSGANSNGFNVFTITGDTSVQGGTWTHTENGLGFNAAAPNAYRLNVAVGGNFSLGISAAIDVTNKGYAPGAPSYNGGGGHGGYGGGAGLVGQAPYGSIFEPILHGVGNGTTGGSGNVAGGGAIYLVVSGTASIEGDVVATNQHGASPSFIRAGAGGSIYLEAESLAGTGSINATGGATNGGQSNTSNGGGGRIAVVLTGENADFTGFEGTFVAPPGKEGFGNQNAYASAGTIYLQSGSQSLGQGIVMIDSANRWGDVTDDWGTPLGAENFTETDIVLARQAKLFTPNNTTYTIGSLSGDATTHVLLNNASSLLQAGGNSSDTTFAGGLLGIGQLVKEGDGVLTLNRASYNFSGMVVVESGTLIVNGEAVTGGVITGNTTNNSLVVSNINTDGLEVGQPLSGTGIRSGSYIVAIDNQANTITLNQEATANQASVSLTFSAGNALGGGSLDVQAGATLGGSGYLAPTGTRGITLAGELAPGNSIGTLSFDLSNTTGTVTFTEDGTLTFELGTPGVSDQVHMIGYADGDLVFNDNIINFVDISGLSNGAYTLFAFFEDDGTTPVAHNISSGLVIGSGLDTFEQAMLDYAAGGGTRIDLVVIPEPGAYMAFFGMVCILMICRRISRGAKAP